MKTGRIPLIRILPSNKNNSRTTCDGAKRCVVASFGVTLVTVDVC